MTSNAFHARHCADGRTSGQKTSGNQSTQLLWNRLAFVAKNRLVKGSLIAVEGRLDNNVYVDKEGVKHYQLQVEAESIENLSREKRTAPMPEPTEPVEEKKAEEKSLSIPDIDKPKGKKKRKP